MRLRVWIATIVLLVAPCAASAREIAYADVFPHYADSITRVMTCGSWHSGELSGHFRVIELFMEGQSFLYVDRVAISRDQTRFEVQRGIAIVELDDNHADIDLASVRCMRKRDGIRITAKAQGGDDMRARAIRIDVRAAADSYVIHGL